MPQKVWNEDLVKALQARHELAWKEQKQAQYKWRDGMRTIEAVRKDIRLTSTGKIYNLPTQSKSFLKTVYEECVKIINGELPIYPPGFTALSPAERQNLEESAFLPYIEQLQRESGGYAILIAFHFSQQESMTKDQICRIGQDYCREQMMENYHAGRMYGAWKANETLARHGLLTVHKAGVSYTNRGFRSNGKNTYMITSDGKRAIQQMLRKWPDIRANTPVSVTTATTPNLNMNPFASTAGLNSAFTLGSGISLGRSIFSRTPTKKSIKSTDDEKELRDWVAMAVKGDTKTFKVGKDRRLFLHRLCDVLEREHPGLRLGHSSSNEGQRRHLHITVAEKGSSVRSIQNPLFPSESPVASARKRTTPTMSGNGYKVDAKNSRKKPRSANEAARRAALARFETYNASASIKSSPVIELDIEDRKMPAKQTSTSKDSVYDNKSGEYCATNKAATKKIHVGVEKVAKSGGVIELLDDDDSDDDSSTGTINLLELSGESDEAITIVDPQGKRELTIFIDDRERSRNHKPREMRIELTKEIKSGNAKRVCPKNVSLGEIREKKLTCGDFAFESKRGNEVKQLSICIERKRIADLIQRSSYGDHWKQLGRMQDNFQHAIMLIEGDCRVANRFDPYGIQNRERKISHHTIENDEDIVIFICRAILFSRKIKFIQTKDERGTYRSISAIGLMANACKNIQRTEDSQVSSKTSQQSQLSDTLTAGGIDWRISKEIAFQFGSLKNLKEHYESCNATITKELLLEPMLRNSLDHHLGRVDMWSKAIYSVVISEDERIAVVKRQFDSMKYLVEESACDQATILYNLYKGRSSNDALNAAFDSTEEVFSSEKRVVHIECSKEYESCFEKPTEFSFYKLFQAQENKLALPYVQFRAIFDNLQSDAIRIHVVDGIEIVGDLCRMITSPSVDFVDVAKSIACKYNGLCKIEQTCTQDDYRVLLVRGLESAINRFAKMSTYRLETPILVDMMIASLMLDHNIVVLQAFRKNISETSMIMRQIALACFNYQLLPKTRHMEAAIISFFKTKGAVTEEPITLKPVVDVFKTLPRFVEDKIPRCMELEKRRAEGELGIVSSKEDFELCWNSLTEDCLRFIDWTNVIAAGGSVAGCLAPIPKEIQDIKGNGQKRMKLRKYFHDEFLPGSDIDLFLYGISEEDAKKKLVEIYDAVQAASPFPVRCFRSTHAINLVSQYPFRHVQIVLRIYSSPSEVLCGFDVDSCAAAYDGTNVLVPPRTALSIMTQSNIVDMSRRSPSYEMRLAKYATRGFEILVEGLDRERVDPFLFEKRFDEAKGLSRLLLLEKLRTPEERLRYRLEKQMKTKGAQNWRLQNKLRKLERDRWNLNRHEGSEGVPLHNAAEMSDYATIYIPWGPAYDASNIERQMKKKDKIMNSIEIKPNGEVTKSKRKYKIHVCAVGTMEEVIANPFPDDPKLPHDLPEESREMLVYGDVSFLVDNPGRQQIGSFNPITNEDWSDGAYFTIEAERLTKSVVIDDGDSIKMILKEQEKEGEEIAKRLLLSKDFLGRTCLHLAALCNSLKACNIILSFDSDKLLQARLPDGRTALHIASMKGNTSIVKSILEKRVKLAEKKVDSSDHVDYDVLFDVLD